ncbi:MAG: hypothetical protein ACFB10_25835 [Salibacteraceae bacterium]
MGDTSNFDIAQTAFLFSWVSNAAAFSKDTKENQAMHIYNTGFDPDNGTSLFSKYGNDLKGGDWELVWGPGVFLTPNTTNFDPSPEQYADNSAFVVKSATQKMYFVGVAGTNPKSSFDWTMEDLSIAQYVDFKTFDPTLATPPSPTSIDTSIDPNDLTSLVDGAKIKAHSAVSSYITHASAIGVWALVSQLKDNTTGKTLGQFLKSLVPLNDYRVLFTGHSLGGALSPTLANWFRKANKLADGQVLAMPVAGPSVGSVAYQRGVIDGWDKHFPSTSIEGTNENNQVKAWNHNIVCQLDVVPHAWNRLYDVLGNADDYFFGNAGNDACPTCQSTTGDNGAKFQNLKSKMGTICQCTPLFKGIVGAAALGLVAYSQTTHVFSYDDDGFSPFKGLKKSTDGIEVFDGQGPLSSDVCTMNDFAAYASAIGNVHVWSYGQVAFGIDISVFQDLGIAL